MQAANSKLLEEVDSLKREVAGITSVADEARWVLALEGQGSQPVCCMWAPGRATMHLTGQVRSIMTLRMHMALYLGAAAGRPSQSKWQR